jgi:hypothetical protein
MKNHENNTLLPDTFAKYSQGDILNFKQEKNVQYNSWESWFIAQVQTEVAVFDKNYFNLLWNDFIINENKFLMKSLMQS